MTSTSRARPGRERCERPSNAPAIACGDQPVLVDLEALFHPQVRQAGPDWLAGDPALRTLTASVDRVGLLPATPLFETPEDLEGAPAIMRAFLAHPVTQRSLQGLSKSAEQATRTALGDTNRERCSVAGIENYGREVGTLLGIRITRHVLAQRSDAARERRIGGIWRQISGGQSKVHTFLAREVGERKSLDATSERA